MSRLNRGLPNTLVVNGLIAAAGLFSGLVLARSLGPEGRGEYVAVVLWPSLLAMVGELGLNFSLAFFAGNKRASISALWTLALLVSVSVGILLAVVGAAVASRSLNLSIEAHLSLMLNMITVPFLLLTGNMVYLLLGSGWLAESNWVRAYTGVSYAVGIGIVAVIGRASIQQYTFVFLFTQISSALLALTLCWWRIKPVWEWQQSQVRPVFVYGAKSYVNSLIGQANLRLDQLIMTILVPASQLGIYAVAVSMSTTIGPIYNAVALVTFSRVAQQPSPAMAGWITQRYAHITVGIGTPIALVMLVLMPQLLPSLFGAAFLPAVLPAQVLIVAAVIQGIGATIGNGLRGAGLPGKAALAEANGLLLTVALLFLLLPSLGAMGAAITSLLSYVVVVFVEIWFMVRFASLSWVSWLQPDWGVIFPPWLQNIWPFSRFMRSAAE
ncbi:MAG TPA: hypothetical protein DCL15_06875 [Chloroflexi bacterium]|nr:hypothetical protein [Chloroflexota bacterium]HHW87789.1 oligosaccharide flippase family protein [Chloroflexota bacterium]